MPDAPSENPVLDTIAAMTAEPVARCGLDDNSLIAARIAALAAVLVAGALCKAGLRHSTDPVSRQEDDRGAGRRHRRARSGANAVGVIEGAPQ